MELQGHRVVVFSLLRNLYTILNIAFPCVYLLATEYLYIVFKSFALPKISQFILLSYKHSLDSLNTSLFSDMCIANIVPRIMAWLFIFSHLEKRRVSILIKSNLSCILLWSMPLRTYLKKICLSQNSKDFLIFLPEIIYLGLVPFEVNFLYL